MIYGPPLEIPVVSPEQKSADLLALEDERDLLKGLLVEAKENAQIREAFLVELLLQKMKLINRVRTLAADRRRNEDSLVARADRIKELCVERQELENELGEVWARLQQSQEALKVFVNKTLPAELAGDMPVQEKGVSGTAKFLEKPYEYGAPQL